MPYLAVDNACFTRIGGPPAELQDMPSYPRKSAFIRGQACSWPPSDSHDVVAAIDVDHFSGDRRRHRAAEKQRGVADFARIDIPAQWRFLGGMLQHRAEVSDAARGERLDRARTDGIDADVARPEIVCQITGARSSAALATPMTL